MTQLFASATALTLAAAPALAHSGAHIHPHGSDLWIAGALITLAALGLYVFGRDRS